MSYVDQARLLHWYCPVCERAHVIGDHDAGKSWPVQTVQADEADRTSFRCWCGRFAGRGRCDQDHDPYDLYRCSCGLHLFTAERAASPAAWERHQAHMARFREQVQARADVAQAGVNLADLPGLARRL